MDFLEDRFREDNFYSCTGKAFTHVSVSDFHPTAPSFETGRLHVINDRGKAG